MENANAPLVYGILLCLNTNIKGSLHKFFIMEGGKNRCTVDGENGSCIEEVTKLMNHASCDLEARQPPAADSRQTEWQSTKSLNNVL